MRVIYLSKRWEHVTRSGGYDRVVDESRAVVVQRSKRSGLAHRIGGLVWKEVVGPKSYLLDYGYKDWLAEWQTIVYAQLRRASIVHVLWGDEQLDLLLRFRSLVPCPLVATFHLPTRRASGRFELQKSLLGGIDLAVVVSTIQLPDFRRWLGPERVVYIPHGIDTDRIHPGGATSTGNSVRLLTVGGHMRDWKSLHMIVDLCANRKLPVEFDIVTRSDFFPYLTGCSGVRLHAGISEEELTVLYSRADALLLPVTDATANNAVLESLACGTPVISTMVGGIPDYVDESCGWLFKEGEVAAVVSLIGQITEDRNVAWSKRAGARARSLEFDWRRVRERLQVAYEALVVKAR